MKKIHLTMLVMAVTAGSIYAQTFVSTSPENRNVVLEAFSGIYNTFDPDAHSRANQMQSANPSDVVVVNIHTGAYAAPSGGDPDFRTTFGSALATQSGLCGYPAGTVNREYFSGYFQTDNSGDPCGPTPTAQNRGTWATTGDLVLAESSSVNVAGQATLDLSSRELTVVVEAYYTGNAVNVTNKIVVAVMENNIEGPQTGSSANPTQALPNGNYNHMHMLRHFMTGQWGEVISNTTAGSFYTNTFTWTVPFDHNGIPIKLADFEIAVYVAEGNEDIISGNGVDISFISPNDYDVMLSNVAIPDYVCGNELTPNASILNLGNETLTDLEILYSVNSGPVLTYNWAGNLPIGGVEDFLLPAINFSHQPINTLWVSTAMPNGYQDQEISNDEGLATFEPAPVSEMIIEVEIVTDNYGYEIYWELLDDNGSVVDSGGNSNVGPNGGGLATASSGDPGAYGDNQTIIESINLNDVGCHTFRIVDSWGDGICCQYGNGSYSIISDGTTLYAGGEFSTDELLVFDAQSCAGSPSFTYVEECNSYTWNGQTYAESGSYVFQSTDQNGCDSLATLHLTIVEGFEYSETFDLCDGESVIVGGVEYSVEGQFTQQYVGQNGCDSIITIGITVDDAPLAEVFGNISISPFSQENYAIAETPGYTIEWSAVNGQVIGGQGTNVVSVFWDGNGFGEVIATLDDGDCSYSYVLIVGSVPTGIENHREEIIVYPNPTDNFIRIDSEDLIHFNYINIVNPLGELILNQTVSPISSFSYELTGSAGIYMIHLISNDGINRQVKVVKL